MIFLISPKGFASSSFVILEKLDKDASISMQLYLCVFIPELCAFSAISLCSDSIDLSHRISSNHITIVHTLACVCNEAFLILFM